MILDLEQLTEKVNGLLSLSDEVELTNEIEILANGLEDAKVMTIEPVFGFKKAEFSLKKLLSAMRDLLKISDVAKIKEGLKEMLKGLPQYGYPKGYPSKYGKAAKYMCTACDWTGDKKDLKDGKCPKCGAKVKEDLGYGKPYGKSILWDRTGQFGMLLDEPVLKVGEWKKNGEGIPQLILNREDLKEIVRNFHALKEMVKPPLKFGHTNEILEREGLPAVGWMSNLYLDGDILKADFSDVPAQVLGIIEKGGYKRKSAEVFTDFKDEEGTSFGQVLRAVALLGADIPEIKTIADIESLYQPIMKEAGIQVYLVEVDREKKAEGNKEADEKLVQENLQLKEQIAKREAKDFVDAQEKAGHILPSFKDTVINLLSQDFGNKIISLGEKQGEATVREGIKHIVESLPPLIDLAEKAKEGEHKEKTDEEKVVELAESIQKEKKCDLKTAMIEAATRIEEEKKGKKTT